MDPERLPFALRGALKGEAALPRALVSRLLDDLRGLGRGGEPGPLASLGVDLTAREREILELLDHSCETAQIAREPPISPVTVRPHISEALRKLGVPDRDAALRLLRGQSRGS